MRYPLYALFFVSGATTLIYEISWTRQLGLLFGHTVLAGSVVLASLFLGLAGGYAVGARLSSSGRPLRWFGICEIVAAIWALCVPTLLGWLHSPTVIQWMSSEDLSWRWLSRATIGILLLLPATISLGATLPLMSQALARQSKCPSRSATIGYAWNTTGAMLGTLTCTYLLLVQLGVARSSLLAGGVGFAVGAIAIAYSFRFGASESEIDDSAFPGFVASRASLAVYAIAGLSGFVTLVLEILYTRLFSLVFHNSTYTFGNVVAVFLLALAVGSALVAVTSRRFKPETMLFWCGLTGAVSVLFFLALFVGFTRLNYFVSGDTFVIHVLLGFGLVFAFVVIPVTLCGMIFPATWQLLTTGNATGQIIGRLAMVNAIGAACGALSASLQYYRRLGYGVDLSYRLCCFWPSLFWRRCWANQNGDGPRWL